jgi:hypothetical protein
MGLTKRSPEKNRDFAAGTLEGNCRLSETNREIRGQQRSFSSLHRAAESQPNICWPGRPVLTENEMVSENLYCAISPVLKTNLRYNQRQVALLAIAKNVAAAGCSPLPAGTPRGRSKLCTRRDFFR